MIIDKEKIKEGSKKDLGLVLTPKKTAIYIISKIGPISKEQNVLDPCVGPGIFVESLLDSGVNPNQITTFDIDSEYKEKIKSLGINFIEQDALLSLNPFSYKQFDFIVGNPPYLNKASDYVRKNKGDLKNLYGKINAHETYAMFIVNSIWRLKEGGKLGFITSDSFLTLRTHTKLRKFILRYCKINEILLAPKNLFDDQDVSTSTAIIILTKNSKKNQQSERLNNLMTIIPRVESQEEYLSPKKILKIKQKKYYLLPFNIFFTDVEPEIIEFFEKAPRLKKFIKGDIGMHTHNNRKYIAAIEGTDLAEIFRKRNEKIKDPNKKYKIISQKDFKSERWKPYLKRGGSEQYYRRIMEALDWRDESIKIYDIPNNVTFEKEGIVISGVSSRLSARYMPKGCYWDSNKAIGFYIIDDSISINYALGLLNSSLYNYLAKGIINNTNSIQISGIHALPILEPNKELKQEVEKLVKIIISNLKTNKDYSFIEEQKKIDNLIYNFYSSKFNFPETLKQKLNEKFSIY
ncbi:MAG: N-6 DNA methylase [Candidatus Lokiarchaeota archaeon]